MIKKLAFAFCLGIFIGISSMAIYWNYSHPFKSSYNYSDPNKTERLVTFLEAKDIPYSYKIDHLKKVWITPHIQDKGLLNKVMQEFEQLHSKQP
ncbi:MAG: hypothetical protein HWE16_14265 [Gammaproteobacteria bacterium]|nr:hypothetical protein [Gammaproteobacteria bacterium]